MAEYVPIDDILNSEHSSRVVGTDKPRFGVDVTPQTLNFPIDSFIRDVTIHNTGWDKITLHRIVVIGPWRLTGDFDRIILPGGTLTISVHYAPTTDKQDDRGGLFVDCGEAVGSKLCVLLGSSADENLPPVGPRTRFKCRRGFNTDQWVIWTPWTEWGKEEKLLPFPEWRQHLKHQDLYQLREAGLDFVRMPVDPAVFLASTTTLLRPKIYQSVVDSVKFLQSAGFRVIVDMHAIGGSNPNAPQMEEYFNNPAVFDEYVGVVGELARLIKAEFHADDVALEIMNEPTAGGTNATWMAAWPKMQKRLYDVARTNMPDHTIVLKAADDNAEYMMAQCDPTLYNDNNILWSFHSYIPFLISHQGATWAGDVVGHVKNIPYPLWSVPPVELDARLEEIYADVRATANPDRVDGIIWYIDHELHAIDTPAKMDLVVNKPFELMQAWGRKYGINPDNIMLGEFGIIRQEYGKPYIVDPDQRAAFYQDIITRAEFYGYPWALWSFGGAFGIIEEFEYRPSEPNTFEMLKRLHPIKI